MNDIFSFAILAFTSFISLINPLGIMPVFLTMTSDFDEATRRKTARKAGITAFLTLILFAMGGQLLFSFFNISVNSLRIVGGFIFFFMGMDMLQARLSKVKLQEEEVKSYVNDISITPLAIPMICGPGALTNAIVLMEDADSLAKKLVLFGIITIVIATTYIVLLSSGKIIKVLGETGNKVMLRLMGLIIMVIAVEFFFAGLKPFVLDIIQAARVGN